MNRWLCSILDDEKKSFTHIILGSLCLLKLSDTYGKLMVVFCLHLTYLPLAA